MMNKKKFYFISGLLKSQNDLLNGKDELLGELYDLCDNEEQRELVRQLLVDFSFMDENVYNLCLMEMSKHIVGLGYLLDECLLVATAHDHLPDSSQSVLQELKLYTEMAGLPAANYCNRFDRCFRTNFQHIQHFFVVDDFVGSGRTLLNRKNEFERIMCSQGRTCSLHFIVVSGMKFAIERLRKQGIDIYCSYEMDRGISEKFRPSEIEHKIQLMSSLENKLASRINETLLSEYHLGYGESEALFCRKNKNIPNNVFPIFWWKEYADHSNRNTLFRRIQVGY